MSATDLPSLGPARNRKPLGASASNGSIEMSNPFAGNQDSKRILWLVFCAGKLHSSYITVVWGLS